MSNLISSQAAIDALCDNCDHVEAVCPHYPCKQYMAIENLPSAQPETHGKRTETHACDCIGREAAIDAVCAVCGNDCDKSEFVYNAPQDEQVILCPEHYVLCTLPPAHSEQCWIPCRERLPENEYVLISKKPTKISGSKWSVDIAIRTSDSRSRKIQWRDSGFGVIQDDKVLAWMPLPEPYKEMQKDEKTDI